MAVAAESAQANTPAANTGLTDRAKAVYVPTSANYTVLLSPANPDGFVAALRSRAR